MSKYDEKPCWTCAQKPEHRTRIPDPSLILNHGTRYYFSIYIYDLGEGKKRRAIKKLVKKVLARGSPNEFHSQSPMRTVPGE